MLLKEILTAGADNTGNHPDDLVRRSILASVLVRAGYLEDTNQALRAFRAWTHQEVRQQFDPETFITRFRETDDNDATLVHE